jgi:hypothetical protein
MAKRKGKATKFTSEPPTASCLLLCEEVTVKYGLDKHILEGIISEMNAPGLPFMTGPGVAYVRMSNVYPNQKMTLRFAHLETAEVVFELSIQAPPNSDPLRNQIIIAPIRPFVIYHSGRYMFGAIHNDIPFAECMIEVKAPSAPLEAQQ